jgi:hypothetical protein
MTVDYKERCNKVCKTMLTILTKKDRITRLNEQTRYRRLGKIYIYIYFVYI